MSRPLPTSKGPFRADQIRSGDPYELSNGHAIHCMTTGARGSRANLLGGSVLDSDPAVEEAGIDTGYAPSPETLRAPDVAVGNVPNTPGWVQGAPPLAVEYADTGQDEKELSAKISELLAAGTKIVWVVRLSGPRRVEVHQNGQDLRLVGPGEELTAPGILQNPVPVNALYDRQAAHAVTLRNLLQRQGYQDLDEIRSEGQQQALRESILAVLEARGLSVDDAARSVLEATDDPDALRHRLTRAATAATTEEVFAVA
ncbi:MAG TPA: Uma2 family endonuclease [Thermoanaerobaculia bacterium]|nr:Uma2 family endonuclease [Thermoanaerobaculia bacterium]